MLHGFTNGSPQLLGKHVSVVGATEARMNVNTEVPASPYAV